MSTSLLFGAGAIVTFITLWGVIMAGGLFATRRRTTPSSLPRPRRFSSWGPVVIESELPVNEAPLRVVDS